MDPSKDQPSPFSLGDAFADVPLFREIQRVLLSSPGPINWELARQVGIATASWESPEDATSSEEDRRGLADTVRAAELAIVEFTGLATPVELTDVRTVRRGQWVEANIEALRGLVEPVAVKLAATLGQGVPEGMASDEELGGQAQGAEMMGAMLQQLGPLLMGAQIGSVLGSLAQRVWGQYDLPVPRPGGAVVFVMPNIAAFERDWSLPPVEFRAWVALHEVTHRLEFARPWVREHFTSVVRDMVEHAELDLAGLERRLEGLDLSNPEALGQAVEGMGNLFGETSDPEQRLRVARVQAFIAAAEGYGDHVAESLGRTMLTSYPMIREALRRHREGRHGEQALERLLGLELTAEQYEVGRSFCARVAEDADENTLARMWDSAETLPSMPELEEASLWLARVV
ncbi:MAG TPA: zinc-dependent metalloprotease [Actinomycetota bacterium]|nr:zinc-dependent metalloprotease [Actinomycetota bacterium]